MECMLYEKPSLKTFDQIDLDLRESAARNKFGVLAVHDLQQTMRNKGVDFPKRVLVYEVCNPREASEVLTANGAVSTALPCRISVYEGEGDVRLATLLPTALIGMFGDPALEPVAQRVEQTLKTIMDEAA
jgi:uncharacterized protein (DUF302 family)